MKYLPAILEQSNFPALHWVWTYLSDARITPATSAGVASSGRSSIFIGRPVMSVSQLASFVNPGTARKVWSPAVRLLPLMVGSVRPSSDRMRTTHAVSKFHAASSCAWPLSQEGGLSQGRSCKIPSRPVFLTNHFQAVSAKASAWLRASFRCQSCSPAFPAVRGLSDGF